MCAFRIRFSHHYPKLNEQKEAVLIRVVVRDRKDLPQKFVDYDTNFTKQDGGVDYFPLPENKYMILYFIGCDLIPFTTVRRFTEEKYNFYNSAISQIFSVEYKQNI